MWRPWDLEGDEGLGALTAGLIERAVKEGTEDEVDGLIDEVMGTAYPQALAAFGDGVANRLNRSAPAMLAEHRRMRKAFEYRLDWVWGDALDRLYAVIVSCMELGETFNRDLRPAAVADGDLRFDVLVSLHARACLVTMEIHALLRAGYPLGARARWRTLHEVTVVAAIIAEGDQELANRYRLHGAAEAYEDALAAEQHGGASDAVVAPDELADLKEIHDAAVAAYGPRFAKSWRWAEPVTPGESPEFWRLEKIAGLQHLRPDFRTASHLIHAGSRGTDLGQVDFRGQTVLRTGPVNDGLAEPGHGAAISLVNVTFALICHGRPFDYGPQVLAAMRAVSALTEETGVALLAAHEHVERLEHEFNQADAGSIAAKVANNLRRSLARGRWRVRRRRRELTAVARRRWQPRR